MHPWQRGLTFWNTLCGLYLVIFGAYWVYNLAHLVFELKTAADIQHFTTNKLGLSERQLQSVTWPEVVSRIVLVWSLSTITCIFINSSPPWHTDNSATLQAQKSTRLCIVRDLTEHDIVSRIMRKENYLIGMLNRGVLALHVALPWIRTRFMLTKTLEWNLHWCLLDSMFDDSFRIRPAFVSSPGTLERRFR